MAVEDQYRARLVAELDDKKSFLSRTYEDALADERDLSELENEGVEAAQARITELEAAIRRVDETTATRDAVADIQHVAARAQVKRERAQLQVSERPPSLGDFVDSDAFRGWGGNGKSGRYTIATRATALRATLTEGAAPGSALLPNPPKYALPQGVSETPLLDVISKLQVSTSSIDLVTYGSPKGATGAAVVAEAAKKPEASVTATSTTVNVNTVAYWLKVTRQLLQDAPAARSFIDDQLRRGLVTKMEADVSAAITGGSYTATTGASKQTALEVARTGIATVQAAGFRPNAILCSPADAAAFDLALYTKTMSGALFGASTWGLQVIPVAGLTGIYVGDFATGVTLVERTGVEVFISDSDGTDFVSNIFTILAEARYAAVVSQPAAITKLTITP